MSIITKRTSSGLCEIKLLKVNIRGVKLIDIPF